MSLNETEATFDVSRAIKHVRHERMLFLNKYGPNAYDSNLYTLVKFADEVERLRAIEQRAKELADEPYSKIGPAAGYAEWILRGNED